MIIRIIISVLFNVVAIKLLLQYSCTTKKLKIYILGLFLQNRCKVIQFVFNYNFIKLQKMVDFHVKYKILNLFVDCTLKNKSSPGEELY